LTVRDNGQGMDQQTLQRIFEPLYTTKAGRQQPGTGLGLSLCHTIIHRLGGSLHADSDGPGQGSVLTIQLPHASTTETSKTSEANQNNASPDVSFDQETSDRPMRIPLRRAGT
jgi:two-component system NtrC family sensor kinase